MRHEIKKITYAEQVNTALITTADGKKIAIEIYPDCTEPCNLGTSNHV